MDKLRGSMGSLSSMQLTADIEGLDAQSKTIYYLARRLTSQLSLITAEMILWPR